MNKPRTFGINVLGDTAIHPVTEQLEMIREAGFGAFFTHWKPEQTQQIAKKAAQCGLSYYSIHAPCHETPLLWQRGDAGDATADTLLACITDCAQYGIPVMVIHPSIGYRPLTEPQFGLARYGRMIETAERLGVTIGFENLETEAYLAAVMNAFRYSPACGFCYDTGHEQCHNFGKDMMALYGEKLCLTHINDNHGRFVPEDDKIHWGDNDLHLPPGDGIVPWDKVMDRIAKSPYTGPLMCELKLHNIRGRHDHDRYRAMPLYDFYALALERLQAVSDGRI